MARVPYLDQNDLEERYKFVLDHPINLLRALANHAEAAAVFAGVGPWLRDVASLDGRIRELAIVQTTYVNRCAYAFCHHVKVGAGHGVTDSDIWDVVAESSGKSTELPEIEKVALLAARELSIEGVLRPSTWQRLNDLLGLEQALELILVISFYNHIVRVIGALDIDIEPDWWPEAAETFPPFNSELGWR